ncbi:MAG: MarR family transcriptional regulator [Methanospirillum sp.]
MAVRRAILVPLAGLLVLVLLVPAVAAIGGTQQGERRSHDPIMEVAGAAIGAGEIAAVAQNPAAGTFGAASLGGGHGYRVGSGLFAGSAEGGKSAGVPGPEVSPAPTRPDTVQPQAARVRGGPAGGPPRGNWPGPTGSGDGHHRGPPSADPVPFAAPTRSPHEQNGTEPGQGGAGRGRKDASHLPLPVAEGTEAPDPILLLRFLLVLGFRRVRPGNVLEHPLRRALYSAIGIDPGLDLAGCAAATGANRETLRYHLALLVCCGRVIEETRSGSVRYFPHDPVLTPLHRALLHALRNESLAPMLAAIRNAPGISRHELADRLGVAGPSVTRQVQRLIEDGLVEAERCGRLQCYRLTGACQLALDQGSAATVEDGGANDLASA